MQLSQLQMVKQILETGSLSKTAVRLNWAQSVVSRQLAALERECGGRIFYRNGRGVVLTELGERILPKIETIIEAAQDITGCGAQYRNELSGEVRLAVSPQIGPFLAGALFTRLQRDHPKVRLSLSEAFSVTVKSDIHEGRTDIAVFMRTGSAVGPDDRVICELDTYVLGPAGSPLLAEPTIDFAQLSRVPLLLQSGSSPWRSILDEVSSRRGVTLNIVAEVNSPGPTQNLLLQGVGYMINPLVTGPAADCMGWIAADVRAGRLSASRLIDPPHSSRLVVSAASTSRRTVGVIAGMIEKMLREVICGSAEPAKQPNREPELA